MIRAVPIVLGFAGFALLAAGCQSTQSKSAEIGAELGPVKQEQGLKITKPSKDVKAVAKTVLSDANGAAVVVRVRSTAKQDLVDVPIAIDVLDAKGRSIYRNDLPGLEPALTTIPYVEAGGEVLWVNDQVLATGKPASVQVTIGAGGTPYGDELPKFEVDPPKIEGDPYSGVVASGEVVNASGEVQPRLLLYAVAEAGGEVVAAGRGALEKMKDRAKPVPYSIYFIGDPRGAEVEVASFPTLPGFEQ